jgi:uncharacterized membrane protein YGL010W
VTFQPEVPLEEVERRINAGELSKWETYRLMHQHPLNKLTHVFGIPLVLASVAWPAWAWFAHGRFDWQAMLALGGVGWFLQLLGHRIEGNRPAFFRDLNQMVIGPLFLLSLPFQLLRRRAPDEGKP